MSAYINRIFSKINQLLPQGNNASAQGKCHETFSDALKEAGISFNSWLTARKSFYSNLSLELLSKLRLEYPEHVAALLTTADDICLHRFNFLGSGTFHAVDPVRSPWGGYQPIDWYLDPVRKLRFPEKIYYKEWDLYKMRPDNADIKYPWELGRCQHLPVLAQAWILTQDEKYIKEIYLQIRDFNDANPIGYGINWTCTMDVALRTLNWILALDMIRNTNVIDSSEIFKIYELVYGHAKFIYSNLENTYEVTSNHYLSNIVGLFYAAVLFDELTEGKEWLDYCLKAIDREMEVQVNLDGMDYESSVPYHRLVAELFLGVARVAETNNIILNKSFKCRLKSMIEFLSIILRPDGLMPQVGDADDGRLHIFTNYGRWNPQDPRHIFGPSAFYFSEPAWLDQGDVDAEWEAIWWGYKPEKKIKIEKTGDVCRIFDDSGLAVCKSDNNYLLITNSKVGTNGFGNHKHNDQLSFEYHIAGIALVVDPGSYVYTSDFEARNYFRSTFSHNSVIIDGVEQNEFKSEWLFRMFEKASPQLIEYKNENDEFFYNGEHSGYLRLNNKVLHERKFYFKLKSGCLTIIDAFRGVGHNKLQWNFCLSPKIHDISNMKSRVIFVTETGKELTALHYDERLNLIIKDGWYSPSYGRREKVFNICFDLDIELLDSENFEFSFHPIGISDVH